MQVEDRLTCIGPDVGDDAVSALEAGVGGERPHRAEQLRQQLAVGIGQVLDVRDVAGRIRIVERTAPTSWPPPLTD